MTNVVMTIVTTVAMDYCRMTHAIFFLIYGCPMSGTDLKKSQMYFLTYGLLMTMPRRSTQRSPAQKSGEPKMTTNVRSRTLAVVAAIAGTSRVCGVLSHRQNLSKLRVSQIVGARCDDGSREMLMKLLKIIHDSAL